MTGQTNQTPKFYALLIGIDCYLPNQLCGNLGGCVRDINHVEAFLKNTLKVPEEQIFKLTASKSDGSTAPKEPPELWPTYKNMVEKFNELTETGQPNDYVYIHYSGHGGRAKTNYSDLKGDDGVDETLVPTDIGQGQYLRDLELAFLLQRMVDKELVVTVVLDSCHSGGATRGGEAIARGLKVVDETPRSTESLVAPPEKLIETWQSLTKKTRNITSTSGLLPEPKGYTLLAACRDNEVAWEDVFEGNESNGALTYWLLDSLKKLGTGVTYKVLHDRILAKIHNHFDRKQTPMLQGEGDRTAFGTNSVSHELTVPVKQVDLAQNRVQLEAGQAQGIRKGAEFVIYPPGTTDLTQTDKRLALVQIKELGAVASWAEITELMGESKIEQIEEGAPALLLYPSVKLVRKIRLLPPEENNQPEGIDPHAALQAVEAAIEEGKGWVELVSDDEVDEKFDYQVSINATGEYEILDRTGTAISNLQPALKVGDSNAASTVVKRLVHLSKYRATLELDNHDTQSPLKGKIKVELCLAPEDYDPADRIEFTPFNEPGNVPTTDVERYAFLRIRNESSQPLNITVLAIQPDWSIQKCYPSGAAFEILEAGRSTRPWRFKTSLPDGYKEGADFLKVFATLDATSFDWLTLPALDKPIQGRNPGKATTPLEKLLAAFASEEGPSKKNVNSAAYASEEWITEQVELVVRKM